MEDKRTRKERNMRSRSVFCTVFTSLLLVLLVQMGVLIGLAWAGGGMAQHGRNPWGACLAVLLLGLVTAGAGSLLISRRVSRPVRQLFREVGGIPAEKRRDSRICPGRGLRRSTGFRMRSPG